MKRTLLNPAFLGAQLSAAGLDLSATNQNITLANGAILVDEFDPVIFDDVNRESVIWPFIQKRTSPGDFTNGFAQSAVGNARRADKRAMSYSAASPTRAARTPQEIKAIVRDITFGMYDRSVYRQQGQQFGDLTAKDVQDGYVSIMRQWNGDFYDGNATSDALAFNGLKALIGSGTAIAATTSVVRAIQDQVVAMINSSAKGVRPTHVICNAMVAHYISQEYMKAGDKWPYIQPSGATPGGQPAAIDTAAGRLPLIVDPFCAIVAGTPNTYPTYIISADKLVWYYVEPLGQAGPDPKLFEIVMTNALDQQYKGVMFGALDTLYSGAVTDHQYRLNIAERTTVVDPTA